MRKPLIFISFAALLITANPIDAHAKKNHEAALTKQEFLNTQEKKFFQSGAKTSKLTRSQFLAQKAKLFDKIDTNRDGKITNKERKASKEKYNEKSTLKKIR